MEKDNERKIERRAKSMILSKDIPSSKMDAVRSLLNNSGLNKHEKYSAIIQLIQDCPDKPVVFDKPVQPAASQEKNNETAPQQTRKSTMKSIDVPPAMKPAQTSMFVDEVYMAYRSFNIFKKRHLIHSNNVIKFWFKKRLIPNRRFFKVMKEIISYQEKVLIRLPSIMNSIVEDPEIEDPTVYNYLRELRKWMLDNPFIKLGYSSASWLDSNSFEAEISNYVRYYYGFETLDTELKEHIILTIENKLRDIVDAKKSDATNSAGESQSNLAAEKIVYEYMMIIRSFISNSDAGRGLVDKYLSSSTGLTSLEKFLKITIDALIFKRKTDLSEIKTYLNISPITVKRKQWECSNEFLKKAGKDPESIRKYKVSRLQNELSPYNEIVEFVNLKIDGRDFLAKAFDEHWHIINKRRNEYANFAEESFFYYIDDCIHYFSHAYVPFIDGSEKKLINQHKDVFESSIFDRGYFENKLALLSDLQRDLLDYRTQNPNEMISFDEIKKIMSGKLTTMSHIRTFLSQIGALFYDLATELFIVFQSHKKWASKENKDISYLRTPLNRDDLTSDTAAIPIPFYDCKIGQQEKMAPIQKTFVGKLVFSDSVREGILKNIIAFCYQMAYECGNQTLRHDMEIRRDLKRQINLLLQ
jgi:hypothetical protein